MIAAGLTLGSAHAEPGPGWVDPPAKDGSTKDLLAKRAEPARPDTPPSTVEAPANRTSNPPEPAIVQTPAAKSDAAAKPDVVAKPDVAAKTEPAATARASGAKPSRQRDVRRSIRQSPSPLAVSSPPSVQANDPRFIEWAGRAQRLTTDYLDSISSPNAVTLAEAARFYGPQVRRFGRMETLASVLADKRLFAARWPERRYAAQADAIRTACNAAQQACIVRATFDYRAGSAARGAQAQGVAELVLEISFAAGRPVIVSESSRVLRRGTSAGLVDAAAKRGS